MTDSQGPEIWVVPIPPEPTAVFWLSFVDPDREEGDRFLGVSIVRARDEMDAVQVAWALDINPGGEVLIVGPIPDGTYAAEDMGRLLNEADAIRVGGTQEE